MIARHVVGTCFAVWGIVALAVAGDNTPVPELGPEGDIVKLHGDLQFTEGPAWDGKGHLYFTDIPADRIYKTDGKTLEVFAEPAGHCNGLMFDGDGLLYACSMDGALVSFDRDGEKTVLAAEHDGQRFNAPNDLVIDKTGGVYFTDPRFRSPMPLPQGEEAVYYRTLDGTVTRLATETADKAPNGVILSPDEKTLYVVCSMQDEIMAYAVESPGTIGEGRVFARLKQPEGRSETGGDGLTVDTQGNLYITSQLGAQVFSPDGTLLGVIPFPEQPANLTFGGPDGTTLYATARTSLYAVPMKTKGHVFPGKAAWSKLQRRRN